MHKFIIALALFFIPTAYSADPQTLSGHPNASGPGKVIMLFDVDTTGRVTHIRPLSAQPDGAFNAEIVQAMKKWRFAQGKPSSGNKVIIIIRRKGPLDEVPQPNQPGSIRSKAVPFR